MLQAPGAALHALPPNGCIAGRWLSALWVQEFAQGCASRPKHIARRSVLFSDHLNVHLINHQSVDVHRFDLMSNFALVKSQLVVVSTDANPNLLSSRRMPPHWPAAQSAQTGETESFPKTLVSVALNPG